MDPHPPAAPPPSTAVLAAEQNVLREFIFERPRSPLLPGAEPSMASFNACRDPGIPGPSSVLPCNSNASSYIMSPVVE